MHSRIYEIDTAPVESDSYITEGDFYEHWFIGQIADYVSDGLQREEELTCLLDSLAKRQITSFISDDSFIIAQDGKEKYFGCQYEKFIQAIHKGTTISLDEFISGAKCGDIVWEIKSSYNDKFGAYVMSDEDLQTFDEFMRCAEPGKRYYIGGILDYHS